MFYKKNLPMWERILRVIVSLIIIGVTFHSPLAAWAKWLIAVSAMVSMGFAFIGFCPMCAMYGRKLK